MILLTREQFREAVLERDGHKCVMCGFTQNLDAHHIMERRLWPDGGYYIDNGATLCGIDHYAAEATVLTPEGIRAAAGITKVLLPPTLYTGEYDKWGNTILPNGTRMPGELYYDESVQKILDYLKPLFVKYVKYPRTPHLPFSPGFNDEYNADVNWQSDTHMEGMEVVVLEKMDGENTTMYRDLVHARSLDMPYHSSRTWIKNLHGQIAHDIPEGWRVCGENLYGEHSLHYESLSSYFMVFSIWDRGTCLSWDDTIDWCQMLDLETVPVMWRGTYNTKDIQSLYVDTLTSEGYVVRPAGEFRLQDFRKLVAKWVRPDHINDDHHWMHNHVVNKNSLEVA